MVSPLLEDVASSPPWATSTPVDFTSTHAAPPDRFVFLATVAAWQAALLVAVLMEVVRLRTRLLEDASPGQWLDGPTHDGTLFVVWLLLGPFCWGYPFRSSSRFGQIFNRLAQVAGTVRSSVKQQFWTCCGLGLLSLGACWFSGQLPVPDESPSVRVGKTVPLIQDELSYQLQARAFLAGRWGWPLPAPATEIFHQTHVLNIGQFASRYFPGTGLWFAPWVAMGFPQAGGLCAAALVTVFIYLAGRKQYGEFAGMTAGLLTALAPAMLIFSHLTLSHLPTLLGLSVFQWAFLMFMSNRKPSFAWIAGGGLTLAMLCRPLTAAAFALPYGIWLVAAWWKAFQLRKTILDPTATVRTWNQMALGLGLPLFAGLVGLCWQNIALTGTVLTTPHSYYNQIYTPRHAFGFHQTRSLTPVQSPHRLVQYDEWAEDLDASLVITNVIQRLRGSLAWWLGLIPLLLTGVFAILTSPWQSRGLQLSLASIVSLHLAHVPYWLNGILEHHYVLESGPQWILIFAVISAQFLQHAGRQRHFWFPAWWSGLLCLSILLNTVAIGSNGCSRLQLGWNSLLQPTRSYRVFETRIHQAPLMRPALILVQTEERDLHAQFVRNMPPFNDEILVGMLRPELYSLKELAQRFPDRTLYLYDTRSANLQQITASPVIHREVN